MKTFDDILRTELQKPVALKNGNGATIEPMEAMVKSVLNNATLTNTLAATREEMNNPDGFIIPEGYNEHE